MNCNAQRIFLKQNSDTHIPNTLGLKLNAKLHASQCIRFEPDFVHGYIPLKVKYADKEKMSLSSSLKIF